MTGLCKVIFPMYRSGPPPSRDDVWPYEPNDGPGFGSPEHPAIRLVARARRENQGGRVVAANERRKLDLSGVRPLDFLERLPLKARLGEVTFSATGNNAFVVDLRRE